MPKYQIDKIPEELRKIEREKHWSRVTILNKINKKGKVLDQATLSNIMNKVRPATIRQAKRIQEVFNIDIFY